ncbi:unnamed protein product, partial [Ectocarpus sp. 12 AP-2014]
RNNGRVNVRRRFQRPLREVVARRAFECVVGTHGELSKVLRITAGSDAALKQTRDRCDQDELQQTETETSSSSSETSGQHHDRHGRHSRVESPGLGCRVEPMLHGEDIDIDHQASSGSFWGVDLHWCDLESLAGLPAELGGSPWAPPGKGSDKEHENEDEDEDEDEDESWRCLYLDASLNRLRGIDAIADEASLRDLVYLDVSYNLLRDLDAVQNLRSIQAGCFSGHECAFPYRMLERLSARDSVFTDTPSNMQVFLASNNQIGSVQALGKRPKKGAGLRHVDLSHNSIRSIEAPRSGYAFRRMKSLKLASNHMISFEEDAALELTSLERLDVSDNELVSIYWVGLIETLRFLDCSKNRLSALPTFARALANPPRLAEVIAEGNTVASESQYRITVLMACKKIRRLDHRPVDRAALKWQLHRATEAKALASLRETANEEYHRCVEEEGIRLERRKSILKAQEKQLEDAFQGFRRQKQREMGECIAYAESLKGDGDGKGLVLTPEVARGFRDAVEDRRQGSEGKSKFAGSGDVTTDERTQDDDRSLKAALRAAVAQEHPEATRSSSSGSNSNCNSCSSGGRRDNNGRLSDDGGHDGTDDLSEYSQHGGGAGRSRANGRSRGREMTSTGGRGGDPDRRGKG